MREFVNLVTANTPVIVHFRPLVVVPGMGDVLRCHMHVVTTHVSVVVDLWSFTVVQPGEVRGWHVNLVAVIDVSMLLFSTGIIF